MGGRQVFYGWFIVALAFVAQFVVTGAMIQCFPVFLLPFSEEFGIGRAEASLPTVLMMLCGIGISPLVGRAVGHFPIRNVMLAGALAMALGCFGLSRATAWWQVLALYGTLGSFSMGALGVVSCNSIVVNWFVQRRAMALGIAMVGMSISGAILIPTSTWVLGNWGWRAVFLCFAVAALALMPAIAWLAVTRPRDMGLLPYGGEPTSPRERDEEMQAPPSTGELLSSRLLWLIAASCGLIFFGSMGIMNHGYAFAVDRGIEPLRAAALLSAISVGAACGKLVFGGLSARLGEKGTFFVAIACQFAGLIGLIELSTYGALVAATGIYGLGIGGVAPLQAAFLAQGFGTRSFGPVMGLIGPLMIPFQVAGPPLAGYVFDTRGSYDLVLWLFLVTTAAAALVVSQIRMPSPDADRDIITGDPLRAPELAETR
jgi:cyanate permease